MFSSTIHPFETFLETSYSFNKWGLSLLLKQLQQPKNETMTDIRNARSLTCTNTMNTALPFLCHYYFISLLDQNNLIGNLFFTIFFFLILELILKFIISFWGLSYDRSIGRSKAKSPQSAIRCFHLQILLHPRSLKATQYPLTSSFSSSRPFYSSIYLSFNNLF